jgi:uncharacterized protein (TIGR00251 family)
MRFEVKVAPGASRNAIDGWLGDVLKLRVTAPPERGKANDAVAQLLAEAVGIPKTNASVVGGHASRRKLVELAGVSEREAFERLGRPGAPGRS